MNPFEKCSLLIGKTLYINVTGVLLRIRTRRGQTIEIPCVRGGVPMLVDGGNLKGYMQPLEGDFNGDMVFPEHFKIQLWPKNVPQDAILIIPEQVAMQMRRVGSGFNYTIASPGYVDEDGRHDGLCIYPSLSEDKKKF